MPCRCLFGDITCLIAMYIYAVAVWLAQGVWGSGVQLCRSRRADPYAGRGVCGGLADGNDGFGAGRGRPEAIL